MKLKTPFSFPDKKNKEINYVKEVYKRRIQNEIDSYFEQEEKPDTIIAQNILYLERFYIKYLTPYFK